MEGGLTRDVLKGLSHKVDQLRGFSRYGLLSQRPKLGSEKLSPGVKVGREAGRVLGGAAAALGVGALGALEGYGDSFSLNASRAKTHTFKDGSTIELKEFTTPEIVAPLTVGALYALSTHLSGITPDHLAFYHHLPALLSYPTVHEPLAKAFLMGATSFAAVKGAVTGLLSAGLATGDGGRGGAILGARMARRFIEGK